MKKDISIPIHKPEGEITENTDLYTAVSIFNTAETFGKKFGKSKYVGPAMYLNALVKDYHEVEEQVASFTKANSDARVVTALCDAYDDRGMIVDCQLYRTTLGSNFVHFVMLVASMTSFSSNGKPLIAYRTSYFGESVANRIYRLVRDGVLDVFEFDLVSRLVPVEFWRTDSREIRGNRGFCISDIITFAKYLDVMGIKFSIVGVDLPPYQYRNLSDRELVEKGMAYMLEEFMKSDNGLMIEVTPEVMMSSVLDKPVIEYLSAK